jgi:transaldolase
MVDRPNLFIKIPATPEGLPAIEETIAAGIPGQRHADLLPRAPPRGGRGLPARHRALAESGGTGPSRIASVASFFVSRVDTEADKRLDEIGGHDELKGTLAIANAKLAVPSYKEIFAGERWEALRRRAPPRSAASGRRRRRRTRSTATCSTSRS